MMRMIGTRGGQKNVEIWPTLKQLAREHDLLVNDLTDAWIAAAVRMLGSRLVTFDRGFKRLLSRNELTLLEP